VKEARKELSRQLVVRVDEELYEALERDAKENGRTVAQSVRFRLSKDLVDSRLSFLQHNGPPRGGPFHVRGSAISDLARCCSPGYRRSIAEKLLESAPPRRQQI
jgi:hypothetical protein